MISADICDNIQRIAMISIITRAQLGTTRTNLDNEDHVKDMDKLHPWSCSCEFGESMLIGK